MLHRLSEISYTSRVFSVKKKKKKPRYWSLAMRMLVRLLSYTSFISPFKERYESFCKRKCIVRGSLEISILSWTSFHSILIRISLTETLKDGD